MSKRAFRRQALLPASPPAASPAPAQTARTPPREANTEGITSFVEGLVLGNFSNILE